VEDTTVTEELSADNSIQKIQEVNVRKLNEKIPGEFELCSTCHFIFF